MTFALISLSSISLPFFHSPRHHTSKLVVIIMGSAGLLLLDSRAMPSMSSLLPLSVSFHSHCPSPLLVHRRSIFYISFSHHTPKIVVIMMESAVVIGSRAQECLVRITSSSLSSPSIHSFHSPSVSLICPGLVE